MNLALSSQIQPMSDLNTTPLIDILLVLLVMLIITLPPVTNSLDLPLPQSPARFAAHPDKVRNRVIVTASDAVLWNGQPVTEAGLDELLAEAAALKPEPVLELAPDGHASYEESARVMRLVKLSGASRVGFVGNERYRDFAR